MQPLSRGSDGLMGLLFNAPSCFTKFSNYNELFLFSTLFPMSSSQEYGWAMFHPEYVQLENQEKILRDELTELVTQKDELQFRTCKNIEVKYMQRIGAYEYKIFELECQIRRLKRKIDLIQAQLNRMKIADVVEIEKQLDNEYAEFNEQIKTKAEAIEKALNLTAPSVFSDEDYDEFKKMYREIAKALHPDLNPDITEKQHRRFLQAVKAFENGDIESMRVFYLLLDKPEEKSKDIEHIGVIEQLQETIQKLQHQKKRILKNIDAIHNSFPYNQLDILSDKQKTAERVAELNKTISEYGEMLELLKQKLSVLLSENEHARSCNT